MTCSLFAIKECNTAAYKRKHTRNQCTDVLQLNLTYASDKLGITINLTTHQRWYTSGRALNTTSQVHKHERGTSAENFGVGSVSLVFPAQCYRHFTCINSLTVHAFEAQILMNKVR